jgi:hypothetical protein
MVRFLFAILLSLSVTWYCDAQSVLSSGDIEIPLNADKYKVVGPHAQKEVHRTRLKYNESLGLATQPSFPGGEDAFKSYLRAYFPLRDRFWYRLSPQSHQAQKFRFSLLVHQDGSISDPIIIRGISFKSNKLSRQLKTFFKHMPNWEPATNKDGVAVDAFTTFTVEASTFFDSMEYMYGNGKDWIGMH